MTRARTLQSAVNRVRAKSRLAAMKTLHFMRSLRLTLAEEAIEIAKKTQNRRLLAEALYCQGICCA